MLEDIYLVFWGSEMEKLTPALMESRRPYRQLRVFGGKSCGIRPRNVGEITCLERTMTVE